MAQNPKVRFHSGDVQPIDYTPSSAVAAGDVVIVNGVAYFAVLAIAANTKGALVFAGGTWKGNKKTGALTAGDLIYWHATESPVTGTASTGAFTGSSSGAVAVGYVITSAASGDQLVEFAKWIPSTVTATITANTGSVVADPGASGAIPVTGSGYTAIVTAGAETRTLAAPSVIGQQLLIYLKTDGGDCVITCATAFNQTGNNTITMGDAGDTVLLIAKEIGANKRWTLVVNDGCALATV